MMSRKDDLARRRDRLAARRASLPNEKRAALIELLQTGSSENSVTGVIPRRPRGEPIPLSFAQERLWIWDQLNPGSVTYNISLAGQITGRLNLHGMNHSLSEIIRRHESLRTNFVNVDGQAVQVVAPAQAFELPIVDLSGLTEAEWEEQARRLASEEAQRPYDLAEDSLLRIALLKYKQQYAVLRTMHHIGSDLWSWGIFMRELGVLYKAYCAGEPSPLSELPLQFADYSYWQRQWLQGDVFEAELSYWKKQLENIQVLNLPTDHPRSATQTFRAASEGMTLPEELAEGLRALTQQEGATLYVILLAALKIMLSHHSGQEDIAVGTVLAGRSRIETESLIGFFLNTLVMRTNLSGARTIRDVIRRVREVFLGAQAHQDMPFEKLIEELKPERSLSRTPLFQVMFSMSSAPAAASDDKTSTPFVDFGFSGLAGKQHVVRFDEAKFDLTVTMAEMADRIGVSFEYNTDLFDATTVQRMIRHYRTLLEQMVADPDRLLATVSLLSEAEQHRMLIEWNDPKSDCRSDLCISRLFETQVARTPDAIAVEDQGQQLTYGGLNSRANQLANYLRKFGVGAESFVGVCMERSIDLMIALWATFKAGAAYVPLDPFLPKNRLRFMIEDSGVALLLSSRRMVSRIPADKASVLCLDADWETIAEEDTSFHYSQTDGENAAYVIYTSGSTGTPKAVVASHAATLNRLEWMWGEYPYGNDDICCQKTIISFVDSVFEILGPTLRGVRVSIFSDGTVKDPARLILALGEKQVTRIILVPSLLRMLFENVPDLQAQIPALKFWMTSGEFLSSDLAESFSRNLPQSALLNTYGSSEVAADATFFNLDSWRGSAAPPLGFPISNTSFYLLDRNKNASPIGAHGDLYVGGVGLARGYLGRPDVTAEKFVPDHLGNTAGARLYNTGDVARCLPNGNIDFIGRKDSQVKIRGIRIELGEIEATLLQHPDVEQAAVIVGESRSGDKRIKAYVVTRQRGSVDNSNLISFLAQKLPDYMVPADLFILESMPLTPSGKVDRIAVSKLDLSQSGNNREYVMPRSLLEMQLVQVWEKVLGVSPIGVNDNFFSLGGTSISAVRLATQIHKHFGQTLTLNVLMQEGNVANLAKLLGKKMGPLTHSPLAVFRSEGSRPPIFFVHSIGGEVLEYYHIARLLGDDQPFYALQAPLGVEPVDENRSIEEVASRYVEALREVQPEGPYLLGGFSWGGVVAFEMAQQLTRRNQKIALLALLDSNPPYATRVKPRIGDESLFLSRVLRGLAPENEGDLLLERDEMELLESGQMYKHALERLKQWGVIEKDVEQETGEAYLRSYIKGYMARIKAHGNYEAKIYPGRITLFRAEPEPKQAYGWSCLSTEPLSIREIAGPHWRIMKEPQVQVLAHQLRECLDSIDCQEELDSQVEYA